MTVEAGYPGKKQTAVYRREPMTRADVTRPGRPQATIHWTGTVPPDQAEPDDRWTHPDGTTHILTPHGWMPDRPPARRTLP